jgi:predicted nucleotidyltransferase
MIGREQIDQAVSILRQVANPTRIVLYGSYATGQADEGSDVDLLVVERHVADPSAEMVRLARLLSPLRIPADVVVVSEEQFNYWRDTPGTLMFEADAEGQVLYEAA